MNTVSSSPDTFDLSGFQGWIDHYARSRGIEIVVDETLPAPMAMPDDIEHPRILVNPRLIHQEMQLSDDEKLVIFFHELEHMFENIELQRTLKGKGVFAEKTRKITESMDTTHPDYLRGYGPRFHPQTGQMKQGAMLALENAIRDIYVNHQVTDPRKAPALRAVMESLYRTKAFKESDYTHLPKHIQFQYAILREAMIPTETCSVGPSVRNFLSQLRTLHTDRLVTEGPLLNRLPAIWYHIEPQYRQWYEEDLAKHDEEKKDQSEQGKGEGESGKGEGNDNTSAEGKKGEEEKRENGTGEGDKGIPTEGQKGKGAQRKVEGTPGEGENPNAPSSGGTKDPEVGEQREGGKPGLIPTPHGQGSQTPDTGEIPEEGDPGKNPFEDLYDIGIPHILPENVELNPPNPLYQGGIKPPTQEDIERILKKLIEKQDAEKNKTPEERAIEDRVKRMGIEPKDGNFNTKKSELQAYERFKNILIDQSDKDGRNLSEALQGIFTRIIAKRQKPRYISKGPVREDRGDGGFDMGAVPGAIADILGGQDSSIVEMYTQQRVREKIDKYVGRFRLHLVADGSYSMSGTKNSEQKKALLLILESLAYMTEQAQNDQKNLVASIEFETSARIFSSSSVHVMKSMSEEFTDHERLEAFSKLDIASGTTGDFVALEQVMTEITGDMDMLEKIRKGEQKEIVIVMTDGGSDDAKKLQAQIAVLRSQGVIVYGIDMAGDGATAVENYGGDDADILGCGRSCPMIADLPGVFVDILAAHIERL